MRLHELNPEAKSTQPPPFLRHPAGFYMPLKMVRNSRYTLKPKMRNGRPVYAYPGGTEWVDD